MGHGLSCSSACGIFLDQESNLLSPALVGGFFTTDPPGKLRAVILNGEVGEGSLEGAIWAKPEGGEKVARRRSGERVLEYRTHVKK